MGPILGFACVVCPGLTRESKYGEGTLYWVDTGITGRLLCLACKLNGRTCYESPFDACCFLLRKSKKTVLQESMEWDEETDKNLDMGAGNAWDMLQDNKGKAF